jgi:two-component system chemotaxis sensor kinase CheA
VIAAMAAAPLPRTDPTAVDDALAGLAEIHTLVHRLRGLDDVRVLDQRIDQIDRELRGVRQEVERLRLLAAGAAFTSLERTARDAAHAAGKQVGFAATGGEVRADAHVLATLHGALVQLVRNAVAHGIELPADRVAAGKPPRGQVTIAVALHGNRIAITCLDDGRGIDLEGVRHQAVRRGMPEAQAVALDRDRLIDLVLRGGLSTATEVTTYAGRGIGLDVVREAAHVLGGEVTVRTSAAGTAIKIVVPTSVAATAALIVNASERIAAIPLSAVRRTARIAELAVVNGPDGAAIAFDDITLPFAPLARLLGAAAGAPQSVVIIDGADGAAALGVDRVIGVEEVVVRALPAGAPIDPLVWGVGLDAEGLPRPVLEPTVLVAAVRATPAQHVAPAVQPLPILIVDDSLTTRMLEQSILESAGYEVDIAVCAEDGLVKVEQRAYGLVLVDVEMPGMDGFGFVTTLRAHPELSALPAILVTSRNRPDDLARGVAVGAQGYVVKGDFDQNKLLELIRRLVRS